MMALFILILSGISALIGIWVDYLIEIKPDSKREKKKLKNQRIINSISSLVLLSGLIATYFQFRSDAQENERKLVRELMYYKKIDTVKAVGVQAKKAIDSIQLQAQSTLSKFDSLNLQVERSRNALIEIHHLSQASIAETKKVFYPVPDSISATVNFSIENSGWQKVFRQENTIDSEFYASKNCSFDTTEHNVTGQILTSILELHQLHRLKLQFITDEGSVMYDSYERANSHFKSIDLCDEDFSVFITEKGIKYILKFKLKFKNSMFFSSALDFERSQVIVDLDAWPGPKNWGRLNAAVLVDTATSIDKITFVFDEKHLLVSKELNVERLNIDSFYIKKVVFIK